MVKQEVSDIQDKINKIINSKSFRRFYMY